MTVSLLAAALAIAAPQTTFTLPPAAERPRDIWVFRSVLDQKPRIATVALHNDLFVAYDGTRGDLYQVWTGGVKFEGAVYTTVHGPQPTSVGRPYIKQSDGRSTWSLVQGSQRTPVEARYRGYRLVNGQVQFEIQIPLPGGRTATVRETPEYVAARSTGDQITLARRFEVTGLPVGTLLEVRSTPYTTNLISTESDGTVAIDPQTGGPWGNVRLLLGSRPVTTLIQVFRKSGVGAGVIMDPEPEGDEPEKSGAQAAEDEDLVSRSQSAQQDTARETEPGLALRVYDVGSPMALLPRLVPGQSPNVNRVVKSPTLGGGDFGFTDRFYAVLTGFLTVPADGKYEFRLRSDDGSRLTLGGKMVTETNRLRGMGDDPAIGSIDLKAGAVPIEILFFQNEGDIGLRVEWKKPGDANFTVIPDGAFSTPRGEVRVTAPGKKLIFGALGKRAGDGSPLDAVHPSYRLETLRPDSFRPRVGGVDFTRDGRLLVCTWDPDGAVYELSNLGGPRDQIKVRRIAAGLAEPLGLRVVGDRIFVLQKQELTELVDLNRDGVIDEYRSIANTWGVTSNFHEFAFGLEHQNGKFYAALATAIDPGGRSTRPQNPDRGTIVEIGLDGRVQFIARGLRTPNGVGFGAGGRMYVTDNQGDWLPSSRVDVIRNGAFYGNRSVPFPSMETKAVTPPVAWLPQGEIGNSPSQPAPLDHGIYKGQMVHGDVTHGGLKRMYVEEVEGVLQGTVFRFTQGLEAGINRVIARGSDFIVGGIGSSGNWGQAGKASYGLQRLRFTGAPTFEVLKVETRRDGLVVTFTEPLAAGMGNDARWFTARDWRYVPTEEYGGPKVDERPLEIKNVTVSADRRTVNLHIPQIQADRVLYLRVHPMLQSQAGRLPWATESWSTINRLPSIPVQAAAAAPAQTPSREAPAELSAEERRAGFRSLFDGRNLDAFKGWNRPTIPRGWSIKDGTLTFTPGTEGGDIATKDEFDNFELRLQWRISEGGNSGIMLRSVEGGNAPPYVTGVEMQVLDNAKHADGANPFTSAGSAYALYAPPYDVTRPVGSWNDVRIVVSGTAYEFYLNGVQTAKFNVASEEWRNKIATSKFNGWNGFGNSFRGRVVLQDHGDVVSYRNIRIRPLGATGR